MKTICVDIDGTLAHYDTWRGDYHFGDPIEGAAKAMRELKEQGWFIVIYTTRANKGAINDFLVKNDIVFDCINDNPYQPENAKGGKPIADVYIDDRAITFEGNWAKAVHDIVNFEVWEKRRSGESFLSFGGAIEALKQGKKVARKGWNGKGMWLWLKFGTQVKAEWCHDDALKAIAEKNGGSIEALGTICMKTADNKILSGWLASQTDMLSEDWVIVE